MQVTSHKRSFSPAVDLAVETGCIRLYSLDIETLISVLQNRRIQGSLDADLSTGGISGPLKNGSVKIELKEGKIISATISDASGHILYQGQDALSRVRRVVLTWQLMETPLSSLNKDVRTDLTVPAQYPPALNQTQSAINPSLPPADRNINSFVPIRRQNLPPERLRYLSRSARSIYALVNGTSSIQRIADLLSLPVDVAYRELLVLQQEQLVTLQSGGYAL